MKVTIDSADMLRLIGSHKGKSLQSLEEIKCPDAYLDVIRKRFDYLRNAMIDLAKGANDEQSGNV